MCESSVQLRKFESTFLDRLENENVSNMDITTNYTNSIFPVYSRCFEDSKQAQNDIRSPTNPEVQTAPLNFEEIRKRLDDLKITREDRGRLKNHEFISASDSCSDSDNDNSLSLWNS